MALELKAESVKALQYKAFLVLYAGLLAIPHYDLISITLGKI